MQLSTRRWVNLTGSLHVYQLHTFHTVLWRLPGLQVHLHQDASDMLCARWTLYKQCFSVVLPVYRYDNQVAQRSTQESSGPSAVYSIIKLEALGQWIPPPRHVLKVSQYGSRSGSESVSGYLTRIASHQHLTICSLAHCQPSLEISRKSVRTFFANKLLTNRQRNRQTNNDDFAFSLSEVTTETVC